MKHSRYWVAIVLAAGAIFLGYLKRDALAAIIEDFRCGQLTVARTSTLTGDVSMAGDLTAVGEVKIDGKYASVGPDATTGLMLDHGSFTNAASGVYTQSFTAAFGAAPNVTCTYGVAPGGGTNPIYVTGIATTQFVGNASASKIVHWLAVGQRP